MEILHFFLCVLLIICSFWVAFSTNPIDSVISLILTFCSAAVALFLFNVEFLGLVFVIIYVGAIAVLFLFVIMMLNIKGHKETFLSLNVFDFRFTISFVLFIVFCFFIYNSLANVFSNSIDVFTEYFLRTNNFFDSLNNIDVIGQSLYNYFLSCVLLCGLILLVALIGSIVLTLKFSVNPKHQLVERQLSRTDQFISFFN
jgi:NADH-quinone oxidoreductase subunit J